MILRSSRKNELSGAVMESSNNPSDNRLIYYQLKTIDVIIIVIVIVLIRTQMNIIKYLKMNSSLLSLNSHLLLQHLVNEVKSIQVKHQRISSQSQSLRVRKRRGETNLELE